MGVISHTPTSSRRPLSAVLRQISARSREGVARSRLREPALNGADLIRWLGWNRESVECFFGLDLISSRQHSRRKLHRVDCNISQFWQNEAKMINVFNGLRRVGMRRGAERSPQCAWGGQVPPQRRHAATSAPGATLNY